MNLVQKLAIGGLALTSLFTAYAQDQVMRVSIPFAFHAGSAMLPAGDYEVRSSHAHAFVAIVAADGSAACNLPIKVRVVPTKARRGSLIFHAYGSSYFLSRVENRGLSDGFDFFTSRAEKEMARINTSREVAVANQGAE